MQKLFGVRSADKGLRNICLETYLNVIYLGLAQKELSKELESSNFCCSELFASRIK